MSKYVLIFPGSKSELVSLQAVLRESHEAQQAGRAQEIAERTKLSIPLDDATDWNAVALQITALGCLPERDSKAVAELAAKLHASVAGHALLALPDYEPVAGYDDVLLRFRGLADSAVQDHMLTVGLAHREAEAASKIEDPTARAKGVRLANEARDQAFLAFIADAVCEVRCGEQVAGSGASGLTQLELEAIRATGLMVPIYLAARDYQRLSPGKGSRFGSAPPST